MNTETMVPVGTAKSPIGVNFAVTGQNLPAINADDVLEFKLTGGTPNKLLSIYYTGLLPAKQTFIGQTNTNGDMDAMFLAPTAGTIVGMYLGVNYYMVDQDGNVVTNQSIFGYEAAAFTPAAPVAPPVLPSIGISALIAAITNGSFTPVYSAPGYASDQTAQQLAMLLGGKVVQLLPFVCTAWATEALANFVQLPNGMTVSASDLSYYANFRNSGTQQLAASLTQEINQGSAITAYNQELLAFLTGKAGAAWPGAGPTFQAGGIGPAIPNMTYPPGCIAADGSVINPMAPIATPIPPTT